jgi:hypothetical protein
MKTLIGKIVLVAIILFAFTYNVDAQKHRHEKRVVVKKHQNWKKNGLAHQTSVMSSVKFRVKSFYLILASVVFKLPIYFSIHIVSCFTPSFNLLFNLFQ